jgi:hypothetical protein
MYPGKKLRYPLNGRLGRPHSWYGLFGEKTFAFTWIRTPDHPSGILVISSYIVF